MKKLIFEFFKLIMMLLMMPVYLIFFFLGALASVIWNGLAMGWGSIGEGLRGREVPGYLDIESRN